MPDILLVKRRWTDSSLVIKPVFEGDHTGEQYSTNGRTYTYFTYIDGTLQFHALASTPFDVLKLHCFTH